VGHVVARISLISLIPVALAALLLTAGRGGAISPPAQPASPPPRVSYASRTDTTAPLHEMPTLPPQAGGPLREAKKAKLLPNRAGSSGVSGPDPALQTSGGVNVPTTGASFEGVNNVDGVLPPDTNGDVGPNHYVQIVNLSFAVWGKSGNLLYGPVANNTLWQGFGGPCQTTNDGDPVVLYDHLADRWMISQFALPSFPRGPFYQCIAISQTGDPLGAWHRYEFTISGTKLNDYGKFGVWPDGYYFATNQFKCSVLRCTWAGQGVVAFERDEMLNGQPARMIYFDLYNVNSNLSGMLPADLDGPSPSAGAPNPFCEIDDDAWLYSPDQIQCWNFHADWANPTSSTFTFSDAIATAAFDSNLCGYSRNCIPQPGGTKVDALSDRLMYRLQYRNSGAYQSLVVNHTVDVNGSDRAGIRWYELRNSGGGWSIFQQGTFSPDADNRWMGSIAMNGRGEMALGYSVSSGSVYPSVRVTGRLPSDPLGTLPQGEATIVGGSGYQQHASGRWGDYSTMSVDPTDDCTFWYTQEYYAVVGSAPWQTRIGSFTLAGCGPASPTPTPSPSPVPTPCPDTDGDSWTDCAEAMIGTDPLAECATSPTHNAWPADLNNDTHSDITDNSSLAGSFGTAVPPAPARHDIAPDPPDRFVDITDVARMAGLFGLTCAPTATPTPTPAPTPAPTPTATP